MIFTTGTRLMSYGRIEIPKDIRKFMKLKTGDRVLLYFEDDRVTLMNPLLEIEKG